MTEYIVTGVVTVPADTEQDAVEIASVTDLRWQVVFARKALAYRGQRPWMGKFSLYIALPSYAAEFGLRMLHGHGVWVTVAQLSPVF
jgi:hypothetical protein